MAARHRRLIVVVLHGPAIHDECLARDKAAPDNRDSYELFKNPVAKSVPPCATQNVLLARLSLEHNGRMLAFGAGGNLDTQNGPADALGLIGHDESR
jgi:hypothetical protein